MNVTIKEVKTEGELKTFIYLPEKIHRNHTNWVPPLFADDKKFFSRDRNPAFDKNPYILLLAIKNGEAVGRIMGIIPSEFNKKHGEQNCRFSYMECFDEAAVFDELINAIINWGRSKGCTEIVGPMGFSDKEPQGFLTAGFQEKTMLITNCSFEYMTGHMMRNGFKPFVELVEYETPLTPETVQQFLPVRERLMRHQLYQLKEFTSISQIRKYIEPVFNLINATYTDVYGSTPISKAEMDEFANRFLFLLNPRLIKMITDSNDNLLAFVIGMSDLGPGVKKARGRLLPFGWWQILQASKHNRRLQLLLGAVHRSYQNRGLTAVLGHALLSAAIAAGFTTMDSHLIMKHNKKMRAEIEGLTGSRVYKEFIIFKKSIA